MTGLRKPLTLAFDEVADPADLSGVLALMESGRRPALLESEMPTGPGSEWVVLPYERINPRGSRFTDPTFGAYYAAGSLETAVLEVGYHRSRFLTESGETSAALIGGTVLEADLDAELVDIRERQTELPHLYASDSAAYGLSQKWARKMRDSGAFGIVYSSVRHRGGQCVCIFRPKVLSRCHPVLRVAYEWNGEAITDVHILKPLGLSP